MNYCNLLDCTISNCIKVKPSLLFHGGKIVSFKEKAMIYNSKGNSYNLIRNREREREG